MKRILVAAVLATFALGSAAMAQDASCEAKAVGKDGKALSGAAKTSFMKKCTVESCEAKAVSSDGKKLAGAAKTSFLKKCEAGT
jgi:opacity protein-like surface antigen